MFAVFVCLSARVRGTYVCAMFAENGGRLRKIVIRWTFAEAVTVSVARLARLAQL